MRLLYALTDAATADLVDFKRSMIVGAHLPGVSMTEAANISGRSRISVSALMTAYTKVGYDRNAQQWMKEKAF